MEIIINGMEAALKKGTSFQFITENRYFTGSDSYTLNIAFPLRGCSQNLKIFGNIGRMDVSKEKIRFDCEIRDGSFNKFGTITITSITPEEVKTQFLEGRSEQNFADDFDFIYINEMNLGAPYSTTDLRSPGIHWAFPEERDYVALPWVNNASGNIQNKADYDAETDSFKWHCDTEGLSFQPYLTYIIYKVTDAVGYTIDISRILDSPYGNLLICNTLPYAWGIPEFAKALPHWSVTEFFEELEKLLYGEFIIDHRAKTIRFEFTKDVMEEVKPIHIDRVLDSYTSDISEDDSQCEYEEAANIKYCDAGHEMWKFYDCPWLISHFRHYRRTVSVSRTETKLVEEDWVREYDTFEQLRQYAYAIKDSASTATSGRADKIMETAKLLYARDIDTYFTFYTLSYDEVKVGLNNISSFKFHMCLLPLNVFGERIVKEDNSNTMELKIVPAWIDYADATYGDILFLDCGSLESAEQAVELQGERGGRAYLQPNAVRICQNGEKNKSEEYFDKIYVGFYDGHVMSDTPSFLPRPALDAIDLRADWSYSYNVGRNLRLNSNTRSAPRPQRYTINTEQKFAFSFLAHHIPDVRALFFINGRRYICEKIESTFSESGMSELQKGTFYEVLDVQSKWDDTQMK
ncbi:MAG: hypothetical protein MJZ60_02345 [Bacteroidaceae bacterium]|nr:hypothetical protein [Bacteroidaceae bacterium]